MRVFRREVHWMVCIRLDRGRGWAPCTQSNHFTRKDAMRALEGLVSGTPWRRAELAVCRVMVSVDQTTAKTAKEKR